jgi:hypothetical protein
MFFKGENQMKKIIIFLTIVISFSLFAEEKKTILKVVEPTEEQLSIATACETVWSCPIVYWKNKKGKEFVTFDCKSVCKSAENQTYTLEEYEEICEYD